MKTTVIFFPFDLFGNGGAGAGTDLLAEGFEELLADNRRERVPTRARAYHGKIRTRYLPFQELADYQDWRRRGRTAARQAWRRGDFVLWVTGSHLGVLPLYDELARQAAGTLIVQFDAHLDVYNLTDCADTLSHGNFLLHVDGPLPRILNLGSRELLLPAEHFSRFYHRVFTAAELALDPAPALEELRQASAAAQRVFIDLDCDVLDAAFFPAVPTIRPFGLSPSLLLRLLDAAWSPRLIGFSIAEFDPGRDRNDQGLATLLWLIEYLLLRLYEAPPSQDASRKP